ncbi:TPM domain-containing protein [Rhodoferax sp. 4810]|nr:TPM domain-containing protein [Rhodoferax jenense]
MLKKFARLLRHRWSGDGLVRQSFSAAVLQKLTHSVQTSESRHSGEIRILIEGGLPNSYLWRDEPLGQIIRSRAVAQFGKLGVWDTENDNGVLIYVLLAEHAIEIVADRGLNHRVSSDTWQQILQTMRDAFRRGEFENGLHLAVDEVNRLLVAHFPLAPGEHNPNELPDKPLLR